MDHPNYLKLNINNDMRLLARQYISLRNNINAASDTITALGNTDEEDLELLNLQNQYMDITDRCDIALIILESMKKKVADYKRSIELYVKRQEQQKED